MTIIAREAIVSHLESTEEFPIALSELQGYLVSEVGPMAYFLMDVIKRDPDGLTSRNALAIFDGEIRVRQSFLDELLDMHGRTLASVKAKHSAKTKPTREKDVSIALALQLGGKREVCVKAGSIDVLTRTELIEVKEYKGWKGAIGQVLAYGTEYPKHKKRIHLFGDRGDISLSMIEDVCKPLGIKLTIE